MEGEGATDRKVARITLRSSITAPTTISQSHAGSGTLSRNTKRPKTTLIEAKTAT
jgi:hypothetical protein